MHWLALREAWWPLAVAVGWVHLRSRQVVEQLLERHPRKPATFTTVDVHAAALKVGGQHTTPEFENSEAAFRELRYLLETNEIEIVGTPFIRISDLEGSSQLEMGSQQTIFYTEISSLVPFVDHGDLCLIPRDWHAAHGSSRTNLHGYRNVLARSGALVRAFPEERAQLARVQPDAAIRPASLENITPDADQAGKTSSPPPRKRRRQKQPTALQKAVFGAFDQLEANGGMPALAGPRNTAVAKVVKDTLCVPVSDRTIRRLLRLHRRKKTKAARPGWPTLTALGQG